MQAEKKHPEAQPPPFTPGLTHDQVRQHAFKLFRDKLEHNTLTLEDWVLAEKDLLSTLGPDDLTAR
jgi:hypothetical protein